MNYCWPSDQLISTKLSAHSVKLIITTVTVIIIIVNEIDNNYRYIAISPVVNMFSLVCLETNITVSRGMNRTICGIIILHHIFGCVTKLNPVFGVKSWHCLACTY